MDPCLQELKLAGPVHRPLLSFDRTFTFTVFHYWIAMIRSSVAYSNNHLHFFHNIAALPRVQNINLDP